MLYTNVEVELCEMKPEAEILKRVQFVNTVQFMFLSQPYKILPFPARQKWPKSTKNNQSRTFDAKNISERSCVRDIRL